MTLRLSGSKGNFNLFRKTRGNAWKRVLYERTEGGTESIDSGEADVRIAPNANLEAL